MSDGYDHVSPLSKGVVSTRFHGSVGNETVIGAEKVVKVSMDIEELLR